MDYIRNAKLAHATFLGIALAIAGLFLQWQYAPTASAGHGSMSVTSVTTENLDEGDTGAGFVEVNFSRALGSGETVRIVYRLVGLNGLSEGDFNLHGGDTLFSTPPGTYGVYVRMLQSGASGTKFRITAVNDSESDEGEAVRFRISQIFFNAPGGISHDRTIYSDRNFDLTIIDNEARPSVPGNLQAVPLGPDSVRLTWDLSDGGLINGQSRTPRYVYQIDGNWGPAWGAIPGGNVTSHIVTGLDTFNNTYQFRIRAESDAGNSWFTGNVTSGNFRPGTPTNLTATTIGPDSVLLEWEAGDAGVWGDGTPITPRYQYDIDGQWRDGPEAGATSHTVTGLDTVNNTYRFRISALAGDARSWWTGYVTSDLLPPPGIASVEITSDPGADGFYVAGDSIEVAVTFSEDVTVSVSPDAERVLPELELDIGGRPRTAELIRGSGARLLFAYVVQAGDGAPNGIALGANTLRVGDGISIQGADGVEADLSHDALPANGNHKVDTVAPTIVSVAITSDPGSDGIYTTGDNIVFSVVFSEELVLHNASLALEVEVGGSQVVLLNNPNLLHGADPNSVAFIYKVQVGDEDEDGVSVGANSLTKFSEDGSVRDAAGNDAGLSHGAVPAGPNHRISAPGGL